MIAPAPGNISTSDYNYLRAFLRDQMGYELGEGKEYLVDGRLGPVAATLGLADVASLLDRLRSAADSKLRDAVIDAMSINETYFFRTPQIFESLRHRIFPMFRMSRRGTRLLRIWCGACSTGQEAYSIAMLIADHFPDLYDWSIQLLATDISDTSLDRAREGLYNQFEVQRGLPIQSLLKHFTKVGDNWRVSDDLRRRVSFQKLNLLDSYNGLFGPFDIVLVRNVLIYFDATRKGAVFSKLRQLIAGDGYLLLGESETVLGLTDEFTLCRENEGFFRPA
jgi:chemotaxis protein methyltransferase CheR